MPSQASAAAAAAEEAPDLDQAYAFAKDLAVAAGEKLLDGLEERRHGVSSDSEANGGSRIKENAVDIVTKTDEDVEEFIRRRIAERYPEHDFIGEETYSRQQQQEGGKGAVPAAERRYLIRAERPTWCVDPLDGTVNYVHGFPMFAVSIGLVVGGRPVVGAICAPLAGQTFHGCAGRGAWLTMSGPSGKTRDIRLPYFGGSTGLSTSPSAPSSSSSPPPPSSPSSSSSSSSLPPLPDDAPRGCLFACEWGKDRWDDGSMESRLRRKVEGFVNMAAAPAPARSRTGSTPSSAVSGGMVHGVRSLGSAALDLAYAAMGAVDVWWEAGCWEWDVAAGMAILIEAGGLVAEAGPRRTGGGGGGDKEKEKDGREGNGKVMESSSGDRGRGDGDFDFDLDSAPVPEARLGGRSYLAIRPAGPNRRGESGRVQQERLVREVWRRTYAPDYGRPGA